MIRLAGLICLAVFACAVATTAMAGLPAGYGQLVLKRSANESVRKATGDLATLLDKSWQETPLIRHERLIEFRKRIIIGTMPDHPEFDDNPLTDEILIERNSHGILISGSDNTATCFAVYRFIEHFLGWRYYQPGPLGLEQLDDPPVPPSLDGEAAILLQETAGFFSRNLSGLGRSTGSPDWSKWNGLRERFKFNHALHRIITPELFETNPGWFAKDENGQPKPPTFSVPHGENPHPDLSNPEVRSHVVSDFTSLFPGPSSLVPRPPTLVPYSLSLADSYIFGHFPDDYQWKPKSYFRRWPDWSNHVFDYTNEVATRITDYWDSLDWGYAGKPPLYLGALTYLTWERPPDFEVHPSIVPYITFDRSQWYDPLSKEDDLSNMESWARKDTQVMGTWDYLFGVGFLIPRSMTEIVADSIPAIHARGIRAYYSQVAGIWPYDLHTTWLTARLLWDPSADAGALLDEFYHEFYGPADRHMQAFFEIAERLWMEQEETGPGLRSSGTGRSTAWWLRYWKDPWQVANWQDADLQKMGILLQDALTTTSAMATRRYYQRIRQTADLFEATRLFVDFEKLSWQVQGGDIGAAAAALSAKQQLQETISSVVKQNPLASYAADLSWVNRYDSIGGALYYFSKHAAGVSDFTSLVPRPWSLILDWCRLQGFHGLPDPSSHNPVLFDTDFSYANNPKIWHKSLMDSEGAVMTGLPGGGGFLANSVRRGNIYQPFTATPGNYYLGSVDIESVQSPSSEIYIRIDFFDTDNQMIAESKRVRIAPVQSNGTNQTLRVLMQAPENTAYGRLFLRFYEMDRESHAILTNPAVHDLGLIPSP